MKRNTTIHAKADFRTTVCGYLLFKEDGAKTNCRATGLIERVTCENCLKKIPITGSDDYGDNG